jgi:hypothetical protein
MASRPVLWNGYFNEVLDTALKQQQACGCIRSARLSGSF